VPARGDPAKSQFDLPSAIGRIRFSTSSARYERRAGIRFLSYIGTLAG
jgi:hypothetical protein